MAKQYQEQAAAHRNEAQDHRDMAEAARRSAKDAHKGFGQRDPSVMKMEKHCAAIAAAADRLAVEDEKAADFHNLRGKELQGKWRGWPCDRPGYRWWDCNASGPCASSHWLAGSWRVGRSEEKEQR